MSSFRLTAGLRNRARAAAVAIGEQMLAMPNAVSQGMEGNAGDALLYLGLGLATGESKFEAAMHAALRRAATGDNPPSLGLFDGVSGLRAVAELACAVEPRYRRLVDQCDAFVESHLPVEAPRIDGFFVFDVIRGWAGVRLARCIGGPREPDRLTELLHWLIADWNRWKCPHPKDPSRVPVHDLGVAHGIAGVLAALTLTHTRYTPTLSSSMLDAARLLASYRVDRGNHFSWPHSLEQERHTRDMAAWCYGAAGVSAALYVAGQALGDQELAAFALDAGRKVARLTNEERLVSELGLCHGIAGTALCFA